MVAASGTYAAEGRLGCLSSLVVLTSTADVGAAGRILGCVACSRSVVPADDGVHVQVLQMEESKEEEPERWKRRGGEGKGHQTS